MRSVKRQRTGNALVWSLKSQDAGLSSILADQFLKDYSKKGKLQSEDLLFNLGPAMLVCDKLIFLGKLSLVIHNF